MSAALGRKTARCSWSRCAERGQRISVSPPDGTGCQEIAENVNNQTEDVSLPSLSTVEQFK